ncbi:MAG: GumC family protein [Bythopirellula sp.]
MSSNSAPNHRVGNLSGLTPAECIGLLVEHRRKWLLPTIAGSVLALGYALVMSRYWEATQGLVVRSEASSTATNEPGKFVDLYAMRTFQETILELARSQQVINATLQSVDGLTEEVSAEEIDELREQLSLLPAGGAEFGKTEVCYLQVKDTDRERAIKLVGELSRQIDLRLRRLREEQSQSLSRELQQKVEQAQAALDLETSRLAELEASVGADLGELRMLNASFSGQSDLRQQSVNLNDERRQASIEVRRLEELLIVLQAAQQDPGQLIAMPNSLLESQPTLRRLKDGLVDAQLRGARLEGTRTENHPQVQAAKQAVQHIRDDLHDELQVAVRGVQVELQLSRQRGSKLEAQYQDVQQRLSNLAGLRADYANRTSAVENSRNVLDQAQKHLGEVRATQVAAHSASLVTPIDKPETGPYPAGPGRSVVVLLGTFGGLAIGLGWLFLTVPTTPTIDDETEAPSNAKQVDPPRAAAAQPATVVTPVPRNIPSSLPPAVAAKIAEIVAARETTIPTETRI